MSNRPCPHVRAYINKLQVFCGLCIDVCLWDSVSLGRGGKKPDINKIVQVLAFLAGPFYMCLDKWTFSPTPQWRQEMAFSWITLHCSVIFRSNSTLLSTHDSPFALCHRCCCCCCWAISCYFHFSSGLWLSSRQEVLSPPLALVCALSYPTACICVCMWTRLFQNTVSMYGERQGWKKTKKTFWIIPAQTVV